MPSFAGPIGLNSFGARSPSPGVPENPFISGMRKVVIALFVQRTIEGAWVILGSEDFRDRAIGQEVIGCRIRGGPACCTRSSDPLQLRAPLQADASINET